MTGITEGWKDGNSPGRHSCRALVQISSGVDYPFPGSALQVEFMRRTRGPCSHHRLPVQFPCKPLLPWTGYRVQCPVQRCHGNSGYGAMLAGTHQVWVSIAFLTSSTPVPPATPLISPSDRLRHVTTRPKNMLVVSTTAWRLRPLIFFPAS